MVLFRGTNPIGPANRDERGPAEELDERIIKYIQMPDKEWNELYEKMYNDRKYPGYDSLKLVLIPAFVYSGIAASLSYELYLKRVALFKYPSNIAKLAVIPFFGLLAFNNLDLARDIWTFRKKYPEMYQP
jgi:hypothetical protein